MRWWSVPWWGIRKPGMPVPAGKDARPKVCLWHIERAPPAEQARCMGTFIRPVVRTPPAGGRRPGLRVDHRGTDHSYCGGFGAPGPAYFARNSPTSRASCPVTMFSGMIAPEKPPFWIA